MNEQAIRVHVVAPTLVALGFARLVSDAAPNMQLTGTSSDASACIAALRHVAVDVVLMDADTVNSKAWIEAISALGTVRLLATTAQRDAARQDEFVLSGARGVLDKNEPPETLYKAIERVNANELWLDRTATSRVFMALAQQQDRTMQDDPARDSFHTLTRKERQVVMAIGTTPGASGKQIANQLNISEHTLRNHLTAVYEKLRVANRVGLYAFIQRHQLHRIFYE